MSFEAKEIGYPSTWPPGAVPGVWRKFGRPQDRMCSWCGATELPSGRIRGRRPPELCPRCPITTEVGRAARPPRRDQRDEGDEDDATPTPRRSPRKDGTMLDVTEKKKPKPEPEKAYSGVFLFRAGADLHERLAVAAERETEALGVPVTMTSMCKKLLEEALTARGSR